MCLLDLFQVQAAPMVGPTVIPIVSYKISDISGRIVAETEESLFTDLVIMVYLLMEYLQHCLIRVFLKEG